MKNPVSYLFTKKAPYFFLLLLPFMACDKVENLAPIEKQLAYFPLKTNQVNIYAVDSTVYNDFSNTVTLHQFKIKDSVAAKYFDALGEENYRIERFKRTGTANWVYQKTISRKIISNRAEEFIDNKRYVRLVFPALLGQQWNGNLYNDLDAWQHEITSLNEPLQLGSNKLDSTLTVNQYSEINLIREDVYQEIYAKNIGLVVKDVKAIDKDISSGKTKRGYVYRMQLESHK